MTRKERRENGYCVDCERDMRDTNQATGNKVNASTWARCFVCMAKQREARYERQRKKW
jgi:hypothetical protein